MGDRQCQLEQVVEGVHAVLDQAPWVTEAVRAWQAIELNPDEQMAYAEEAHTLRFADANGEVRQLLHARRPADDGPTLWKIFQRVQENVVRGGSSAIGNRRQQVTTREVRGIDGNIQLNRALWSLTEKMAALKAASAFAVSRASAGRLFSGTSPEQFE
jgi:hypothetical protein